MSAVVVLFASASLGMNAEVPRTFAAQQAGHGTLPTTGAIAPGSITRVERKEDPVIAGIEELRRVLADTARQYKKAKNVDKIEKKAELPAALARARAEVSAAQALVAAR